MRDADAVALKTADQVKAGRYRLNLQGDVGHDAEDGDQGHQGTQPERFAVAQADEVGNGSDIVFLADLDDAPQDEKPGKSSQRRAEIDQQKVDAGGGGPADAAVKGPRGAVDRNGEGVDIGVPDDAPADDLSVVGIPGDQEDQQSVEK